ncbi:hypothetical protein CDAR_292711 [Caerostris darwini]|uniref:Ycf15 n=1 Tax=Caerostris darwini TaxID=1538125 RepID=A0AAV4PX56_9ARAC|nr:hypothetical protein CDAR_292711 [Caerostris darwini]
MTIAAESGESVCACPKVQNAAAGLYETFEGYQFLFLTKRSVISLPRKPQWDIAHGCFSSNNRSHDSFTPDNRSRGSFSSFK